MYVLTLPGAPQTYDTARTVGDFYYPIALPMKRLETDLSDPEITALITDDNQVLDFYLREKMVMFREKFMQPYKEEFIEDGIPFFY